MITETQKQVLANKLTLEELRMRVVEDAFVDSFKELQADMQATNQKNGFQAEDELIEEFESWIARDVNSATMPERFAKLIPAFRNARVGLKLALAMGELGETLEAVRKNKGADDHCPEFSAETVEVVDAIIRLMNYGANRNLPLAEALVAKNRFNRNREDHQKTARESEHGKQF